MINYCMSLFLHYHYLLEMNKILEDRSSSVNKYLSGNKKIYMYYS